MTTATTTAVTTAPIQSLGILMRALKLPAFSRYAEEVAQKAEREGWTFGQYLHHLAELEVHERRRRRTERFLKAADLPPEKTLATLTRARLPPKVAKMLPTLCEGGFVERGDNILAFGLPGRGKTHLVCAIGYELIQRGYRVLFTATFALVQRLLGEDLSRCGDHLAHRFFPFPAVCRLNACFGIGSSPGSSSDFASCSRRYARHEASFPASRRSDRRARASRASTTSLYAVAPIGPAPTD
jgi:hypothetical protein